MKHLPPLPVLQAFEAAARLGSFSRAAAERNLTPGAVSRHIQALEHWYGAPLFARNGPQVRLTPDGQGLRDRLGEPMQALHDALLAADTVRETPLSLFTLPSIAESLILPHLADFRARHPHIRLSLLTQYAMMSLPPALPVVAVRFGVFDEAGLSVHRSPEEALIAVAAPDWIEQHGTDPAGWPPSDMLRHTDTPWPARLGKTRLRPEGLEVNDAALLKSAARRGLGVIWTRQRLAEADLTAGTLQAIADCHAASGRFYALAYRSELETQPAVTAFRDWFLPYLNGRPAPEP
ncbi:LysR family transcriptional regulator [Asticcacaulis solisilvae]|uniref:LysR family transcriptional regulator n=1 Tax=Asticcacaulis solisilvae TaxID=1217274 RepID=UPI003FD81C19